MGINLYSTGTLTVTNIIMTFTSGIMWQNSIISPLILKCRGRTIQKPWMNVICCYWSTLRDAVVVWNPTHASGGHLKKQSPYKSVLAPILKFISAKDLRDFQFWARKVFGLCWQAAMLCAPGCWAWWKQGCHDPSSRVVPLLMKHDAPALWHDVPLVIITPCETFHISEFRMGQFSHLPGKGAGEALSRGFGIKSQLKLLSSMYRRSNKHAVWGKRWSKKWPELCQSKQHAASKWVRVEEPSSTLSCPVRSMYV